MHHKYENPYFSTIFFEHGYPTYHKLICLKTCMCIVEICMEGWVSQYFDLGLSFCLCYLEEGILKKSTKNHKSYPFFIIK